MYRTDSRYISYGISIFLVSLLLISLTATVDAELDKDHNNNTGNKTCIECHPADYQQYKNGNEQITKQKTNNVMEDNSIGKSQTTPRIFIGFTELIGDITLIASMGQDWYQQGIYGMSSSASLDQSWGWTFFDENPPSGFIVPSEKIIQKNNIYALLLDDGNNSSPISGANVIANITYWIYNGTNYNSNILSVQLTEDINRRGFYTGTFSFYGGTSYKTNYGMDNCDGCHPTAIGHGSFQDNLAGYFPGNYTVSIKANAGGKIKTIDTDFEVTPWGCEDCHSSKNKHYYTGNDMDSACYICHGVTQIGYHNKYKAGNPHQNAAHRNINCVDCHTNKSINSQTFNGVTFINGGINNASIPQYNYETIQLNGGTHSNLDCIDCHRDLTLPNPQGIYKSDNYTINSIINRYNSSFTTIQQFQDCYVINVAGGGPLNISFDWEGMSNLGFYLYPPNFNPRNLTGRPYNNGVANPKPEEYINATPMVGKWMLCSYGYNLSTGPSLLFGTLQSPINYTINSTYPLEKKNLPLIPECNECHNSGGSGGANTQYEIPDWNPGFAHVDTDNDENLDIQCRMCHNAMHNIGTKTCQNCHTSAPTGHFIQDPAFGQYTVGQCLRCHGDPHKVTGGDSCIDCHREDVNISKFGKHANLNTTDGDNIVTDNDCVTCHYNKDMNNNSIYLCHSCHINNTGVVPVNDPTLIIEDFYHGQQTCKNCHAPFKYHMDGTVGPKGLMDLFSFS